LLKVELNVTLSEGNAKFYLNIQSAQTQSNHSCNWLL